MQLNSSRGSVVMPWSPISYRAHPAATRPASQSDTVCPGSAAARAALGAVSGPQGNVMEHLNELSAGYLGPEAGQRLGSLTAPLE